MRRSCSHSVTLTEGARVKNELKGVGWNSFKLYMTNMHLRHTSLHVRSTFILHFVRTLKQRVKNNLLTLNNFLCMCDCLKFKMITNDFCYLYNEAYTDVITISKFKTLIHNKSSTGIFKYIKQVWFLINVIVRLYTSASIGSFFYLNPFNCSLNMS